MSQKYDAFVNALKALCEEHEVQLTVSGYDALQVWDLQPGDDIVHAPSIDDCTKEPPLPAQGELVKVRAWRRLGQAD